MSRTARSIEKKDAARILRNIAALLQIKGENRFRALAYENAARALEDAPEELNALVASRGLEELPGIGKGLADKIAELHNTGRLSYYEKLRAELPETILELTGIAGLGPRKIHVLYEKLGVSSLAALEAAARDGQVASLPGFGEKTAANILRGIDFIRHREHRHLLANAQTEADAVIEALGARILLPPPHPGRAPEGAPALTAFALAGSLRRCKETVKDIDLVGSSTDAEAVMAAFRSLPLATRTVNAGPTKSTIQLESGMQVDLRLVEPEEFAFALLHFTGSAEHNTAMRSRAKERGLKLNEYGLWTQSARIDAATEADIFRALGLAEIAPELREAMGEIEQAAKSPLPTLLRRDDLRGILHCHSNWSDGRQSIAEMVDAARTLGYEYLGLTDHSQTPVYAGGLTPERVREQWAEIDAINARLDGFRVFKGIESDILTDGDLDYDDELLQGFDFVIASVHSQMSMPKEKMTRRLIRAIEHPATTIIGHPSGRLLLGRDGYPVEMSRVIEAAIEHGVAIELNCHPARMDIDWRLLRASIPDGLLTCLSPDAHRVEHFRFQDQGVGVARKGGAQAAHVLNTLGAERLAEHFASTSRRKRRR